MTRTLIDPGSLGQRIDVLGIRFDPIGIDDMIARLRATTRATPYQYLVTPNVDHVVRTLYPKRLSDAELPSLYGQAAFCVCDSRVLSRLARLRGIRLPVVPGSDLTARLFAEVIEPDDLIAVVGGTVDTYDRLRARYPRVRFVHHVPPMRLLDKPAAIEEAAAFVAGAHARFAFLAVGAPQQELIAHAVSLKSGASGVALCIGASIDFLAGAQRRAPRLVQLAGLEWAHRLAGDPSRLWRRYLVDGPRIFAAFARWKRRR